MKLFRLARFLFIAFIGLNFAFQFCNAQAGEWTWIKGAAGTYSPGNYGIQGVPSLTNEPTGRYACGYWTDTASNFWVYGGVTNYNVVTKNDLWKFDPITLMWTWMKGDSANGAQFINHQLGIYDSLNSPGPIGFGMFTWVTSDNHLWLFGGSQPFPFPLNSDLWQYDPTINQWAWMGNFSQINYGTKGIGDSITMPGGRCEGNCAWTDENDNLWLFGGDHGTSAANDVWKYDAKSGIWTWMSGSSNEIDDPGSYGTIGLPSVNNYPSARSTNLFWKDNAGNFWLTGGTQYDADLMYQDIWSFNPKTLEWTWVNGNKGNDREQVGINCISSTGDKDGPRYENRANWKICDDLIITFSGFNDWNLNINVAETDMWAYKVSANEWTKINSWQVNGNYGAEGVPDSTNAPPYRIGGVGFMDKNNHLWLFGGGGNGGYLNDLWEYILDTNCITCSPSCNLAATVINTTDSIFCTNDSTQICAPAGYASFQWNASVTGTGNCIYAKQAGDYYVTVTDINGCSAESNHISISVYPVSSVSIIQQADTLLSYGAVSYQWYFDNNPIPNATNPVYIANQAGSYTLQITDTNGCTALSSAVTITGINNLEDDANVMLYPNPCSVATVQLSVSSELVGSALQIYDDEGRMVFHSAIGNQKSAITLTELPSGVYFLRISSANAILTKKLVKL